MNKEKQIEEMAKDICPLINEYGNCKKCDAELDIEDELCIYKIMAKAFYNADYRKASEIFEEIENVINNELQNNYKVLPQFEFSNELWNKMSGRIEALKEICDFIAERKKKYESEKDNGKV